MKVAERLLVLSSTDLGDEKLAKAGLTTSKILGRVYDGASVMAGHCEEFNVFCKNEKTEIFRMCATRTINCTL